MPSLRPVRNDYIPAYPRSLTPWEVTELLRPGLAARFASKTMALGAVLVGSLSGCGERAVQIPTGGTTFPKPKGATTTTDTALKGKVDQLVAEVLGKYDKSIWYDETSLHLGASLPTNPIVKYPSIPISYGNSCVGIFDTETAKAATLKLFALYGIELKKDVPISGSGFTFQADGYDSKSGIGFKMIMPEQPVGMEFKLPSKETPAKGLSAEELAPLDAAIRAGNVHVFAVDTSAYPLMDGDQFTPMKYYLASVVDYLNWLHGDKQIDLKKVLGSAPGGRSKTSWRYVPPLEGSDAETPNDLGRWTIKNGTIERSDTWSRTGDYSVKIALQAGGEATFALPNSGFALAEDAEFECTLFYDETVEKDATLDVVLVGDNGASVAFKTPLKSRRGNQYIEHYLRQNHGLKRLIAVKIKATLLPSTFYLDGLSIRQR